MLCLYVCVPTQAMAHMQMREMEARSKPLEMRGCVCFAIFLDLASSVSFIL